MQGDSGRPLVYFLQNATEGAKGKHVNEFYFFSTVGVNVRISFENCIQS